MARHDESELTLINEKNIHALNQALKDDRVKLAAALDEVSNTKRQLLQVRQELSDLRLQLVNIMNAGR